LGTLEREDVNPNRLDKDYRTPLWWAASEGHETVVKLLLEPEDADPNRPDKYGATALSYAASGGHERIVQLLRAWKLAQTPDAHLPHYP